MTSMTNSAIATSIVFFGTGEVSLATLEGIAGNISVEAVITKPDLVTSSGHKISPQVKVWAEENGVPCYQPANKAELAELCNKQAFKSPVGLVVDYGIIIPASVIQGFRQGILNSHFSLLPKWRGADPITWTILAGDTTTGVSVMLVDEGMDTGGILVQEEIELAPDETVASLTPKLVGLSNDMLINAIPDYLRGEMKPRVQNHEAASYSSKINKDMGELKPTEKTALELERQVRAFQGWPGSYITVQGTLLAVKSARATSKTTPIGKINRDGKTLLLGCKQGSLQIDSIQPAGKKPMDALGFANGHRNLIS
jgi:methionyl-tRNA formyltransferase